MKSILETLNPFTRGAQRVVEVEAKPRTRLGPPLFIIGAPRSGTTYINTVLNRHPKVFITNELRFMLFYHEAVFKAKDKLANARAQDDFMDHFRRDIRRQVEEFFLTRVTKSSLKTKQKIAIGGGPRISEGCLWGDKNPFVGRSEYEGLIDLMEDVFPDALYVHIYRDPRNSISSRLIRGKGNVGQAIGDWRHILESCRDFGKRLGPRRYFEVKYEELCSAEAEQVAGTIFEFLGLDLHEEVVAFLKSQEHERTPAGTPASGEGDIGDEDVFRKRLTPEQIATIDEGLGDLMDELGYARGA